jgi:hypothetical protein
MTTLENSIAMAAGIRIIQYFTEAGVLFAVGQNKNIVLLLKLVDLFHSQS